MALAAEDRGDPVGAVAVRVPASDTNTRRPRTATPPTWPAPRLGVVRQRPRLLKAVSGSRGDVDNILRPLSSVPGSLPENTISVSRWRHGENIVGKIFRGQGYDVEDHSRQKISATTCWLEKGNMYLSWELKTIKPAQTWLRTTMKKPGCGRREGRPIFDRPFNTEFLGMSSLPSCAIQPAHLQLDRQCRQSVWECSTYNYEPRKFSTS